jgi:hypothetical protein
MTRRTDDSSRVSESKLCDLVGVSQQYRQSLVRRKLVQRAQRAGCTRGDAVELATIELLSRRLAPKELAVAWSELHPQLKAVFPKGRLDVVFDRELGTMVLARSDTELRAAVVSGRAVNVIEVGPRLQEVLDAFDRWASAGVGPPAARTSTRQQTGRA